jgi:hypothetical protein
MCNKVRHRRYEQAQSHRRRLLRLGSKRLVIYKCKEGCLVDNKQPFHVGHPRGKAITKSTRRKRGIW